MSEIPHPEGGKAKDGFAEVAPPMLRVPEEYRGDGPCADCGTLDNIVWFADNTLWNKVVRTHGDDKILCVPCFVVRAMKVFPKIIAWKLIPGSNSP